MAEPSDLFPVRQIAEAVARRDVGGRVLAVVLLAAVGAGSAWLLTPGSRLQPMPGDDALGTPAVGTVKAARDYEIPDDAATRRRRSEAVAAERPVYDHDDGALDEAAARVHGAFQLMRDAESEWRARAGPASRRGRPADAGAAADLGRAWRERRDAFMARLQAVVRDEDFAALAGAHFSEGTERELVGLTVRGLAGYVVEASELLLAERHRGITVRELRDGVAGRERVVPDVAAIRDVAQAREDVEHAGESLPRSLPAPLRAALVRIAGFSVRPTLVLDEAETQRRRQEAAARVKPVVIRLRRGETILADGERIEERHLVVFRGIREQTRGLDLASVRAGGGALVALLVLVLWRYARRNVAAFRPSRKDAVLLAVLFLGNLGLTVGGFAAGGALHDRLPGIAPEAFDTLVPFAAGALLTRALLSAEAALLFSLASGAAVGLAAGHSVFFAIQATLTSVVASSPAGRARSRAGLFRIGARVGAAGALAAAATHLFTGRAGLGPGTLASLGELAAAAGAALVSGALLLPLLAMAVLPPVESAFGYVTDVRLLRLANLNHPALKDLIVQAPGTYHHSVIMGSLVEAAAEAIGANALLARVCAYFHDVGKIRNPLYFGENQRGESRHEGLAPSMSALIVKRHVTDGLELARHWRLPRPVADAIAQHHGTRLVSFFWAKAQRAAGEQPAPGAAPPPGAEESLYRYPGPRPRTREAALVMIADACEASARGLPEATAERLTALVHRRVNEIFGEGQLDECELTLRDLNAIAGAMVRALEAVYRARRDEPTPAHPAEAQPGVQLVAKGQG